MNIHVTLIAYAIDITPLVSSLDAPDVFFHIYLHSKREEAGRIAYWLADMHQNIILHDYRTNRGLARSWNDGIIESYEQGADVAIVLNDDVDISRPDLRLLAQAAVDHRECGIVEPRGYNERMVENQLLGYAAFAVNPIALEKVGYFDENFTPIYFEDCDYSRRCALAGVTFYDAGPTRIVHKGSATINSVPELKNQNNITFSACNAYYHRKWGGEPGQEVFAYPFNDTSLGLKIGANQRAAPYPGYNRTDIQEIVKL